MTTTSEETTLSEDMLAAISELEAEGLETKDAVDKLEPTAQDRGEDGKFKAKDDVKDDVKDETKTDVKDDVKDTKTEPTQPPLGGDPDKVLTQDKAPSSWTPKARESWATLPEDARKEILRREEDSVKGIRQLQEQMAPYTQFAQNLEPFIKEAFDNKMDPGQYIGNVMQSERRLRTGSGEERFTALVEIAETYGIPLRRIINDAVGQEIIPDPFFARKQNALPPEIERELLENRQFRQEMTQNKQTTHDNDLQKQIDDFKKDKEFFEDVRDDMGILMEAGKATTLQEAYDIAIRMNSGVYETLQARAASKNALTDKQKAAAGISGTSSNSAETGNADFDDDDDLATTVRKAAAQSSGRV